MNNQNGICEVCGTPTDQIYLDLGVWKCEGCCNPHYLLNNRNSLIQNRFGEASE